MPEKIEIICEQCYGRNKWRFVPYFTSPCQYPVEGIYAKTRKEAIARVLERFPDAEILPIQNRKRGKRQ